MCFTRFGLIILSVFIRKYPNLYSKRLFEMGGETIPQIAEWKAFARSMQLEMENWNKSETE